MNLPFPVDHYGFVTHDIAYASAVWCGLMGFVPDGPEIVDPAQDVRIQFLRRPLLRSTEPRIELLVPLSEASPVKALARRGGGFHHVCVRVASLDNFAREVFRAPMIAVRAPIAAPAFDGRKIAFAYLMRFGLVEFVESPDAPSLSAFADFITTEGVKESGTQV